MPFQPSYNQSALFLRRYTLASCLIVGLPLFTFPSRAQRSDSPFKTMLVLPFENTSKAAGIDWIAEAFPEVLGQRISSAFVIPREDRLYAFDRLGIPANLYPSRATLYRIAQEMDVDYLVMGSYNLDGYFFSVKVQVLDIAHLHISEPTIESAPLSDLLVTANAVAWDVIRVIMPAAAMARNEFLASSPRVRVDAFENYVRGITASQGRDKIRYLREAVRISPRYTLALLQLGKEYYESHEYGQAASTLVGIPETEAQAREARFYLGLACYYSGDFKRAEEAFAFVAAQMPLTEVYNNLGVVAGRGGERTEIQYLQKAVEADPKDADYRFNLGIALLRIGNTMEASRQLKEGLALRPTDAEAKGLLDSIANSGGKSAEPAANQRAANAMRIPLTRIKRNYDEWQFRQLALEIQNMTERKMMSQPPGVHAQFHNEHGHEMLKQGFPAEAEREFREAISLDPTLAGAHAGLAAVLRARDAAGARTEARTAVHLKPSAEAYLVLVELDLRENNPQAAAEDVDHALALDPENTAAQALKRDVAARTAPKGESDQP